MKSQLAFGIVALGALGLIAPPQANADIKYQLYQRYLQRKADALGQGAPGIGAMLGLFGSMFSETPPTTSAGPQPGTFTQRQDHNDPSNPATFSQRYYVDADYASGPGSPVLFFICGEAACNANSSSGAAMTWAQEHHAYVVSLEHRYYGQSQPFATLETANLKFLTTDEALQDLAAFEDYAKSTLGLTGPWVSVGGSYPGSLSAYYRSRYPNEVAGALSSSGPVMAEASFQAYDLDVATVAGPVCAAVMRTAVKTIEQRLDDPTQVAAVKALFGASDINDPIDFLYVVADMGAIPVQYGFKDVFCNQLTAAGADPVQAYATAGKQAFQIFGITPIQDTPQFAMDTNPADYPDIGIRSWTYQTCVEYGYFQDAYSDPTVSVRSSRINQAYDAQVCQRLFGMNGPNIAATNTTYYQPLLDPAKTSNIFFTNGSTDPWSKLGITQENGNLVNPNVAADLIDGGSHCSDLGPPTSTDTAAITQARTTFDNFLAKWW